MLVTKKSPRTGQENTLDIPITEEQYNYWINSRTLAQVAFPHLSPDQREFLMTGYTSEDWQAIFGEEDNEEDMGDDTP